MKFTSSRPSRAHCNSTIIYFTSASKNLTQFVKVLLVKLSELLHSSNFVGLFHRQSFALYGTFNYFHRQGRWNRSGCSSFGQTIFSQGKNKIHFCKRQVISKVLVSFWDLLGLSRRAVVSREAKKKQYARAFQAYATTTVSYLHGWSV